MLRRTLPWLCVALWMTIPPARASEPDGGWKAGVARVKITPERPLWMSGYASRTHPAEGTLIDLWAKALVLEDPAGRRAALVSLDLVGIDREFSLAVRDELKARYGLSHESMMLACSHTHTGPVVGHTLLAMYQLDESQLAMIAAYTRALHSRVVALVGNAIDDLKPARLRWDIGRAGFAVNRRNNKEPDVPRLREKGLLKGPVDHEVPVLAVEGGGGRLRAVAFGYACHATVLPFYEWSGDYPGFAQIDLEKAHPGAVALFWAGCGGDQNPLPRRSVERARGYGQQLATAVDEVLARPMKPVRGRLTQAYEEIDLPLAKLPTREQVVQDAASRDRYVAARARKLLKDLERSGSLPASYPYPVQAWRLGPDLLWLALGGEVVVDYSLRLKKELGPGRTWVAAYTNDVMNYIPSLRVLREGGYEGGGATVYYGLPAPWGPRVEEAIVAAAHQVAERTRRAARGAK